MPSSFSLHPRLREDCHNIADLPLSRLLLMNDARFPWLILVPRRQGAIELFDLQKGDLQMLSQEIATVSALLKSHCKADKINVAALGNQVPQLHVHVIARFESDPAWPSPVWCCDLPRSCYDLPDTDALISFFQANIHNITKM